MSIDIGNKIKMLRKSKKITQFDLADQLKINRATISNWETGRRNISLPELKRVSEYFGVGLDYFGVAPTDEVFDLISRAKDVFESEDVPKEQKESLYKEIMKLYLNI